MDAQLRALGIFARKQWLQQCVQEYNRSQPRPSAPLPQWILARFLVDDIRRSTDPVHVPLPPNINQLHAKLLSGAMLVQIEACEDISSAAFKATVDPASGEEKEEQVPQRGRRMYKMLLTDGQQQFCAFEYDRVESLDNVTIEALKGGKILIRDAVVRNGLVLLTTHNAHFLGGNQAAIRLPAQAPPAPQRHIQPPPRGDNQAQQAPSRTQPVRPPPAQNRRIVQPPPSQVRQPVRSAVQPNPRSQPVMRPPITYQPVEAPQVPTRHQSVSTVSSNPQAIQQETGSRGVTQGQFSSNAIKEGNTSLPANEGRMTLGGLEHMERFHYLSEVERGRFFVKAHVFDLLKFGFGKDNGAYIAKFKIVISDGHSTRPCVLSSKYAESQMLNLSSAAFRKLFKNDRPAFMAKLKQVQEKLKHLEGVMELLVKDGCDAEIVDVRIPEATTYSNFLLQRLQ